MKVIILIIVLVLSFGFVNDYHYNNSSSIDHTQSLISNETAEVVDTFEYFYMPDNNLSLYTLPKKFIKPENWSKAEKDKKDAYWYGEKYSDTFKLKNALMAIDTAKEYYELRKAVYWCIDHYEQAFPYMVARLSKKIKIGLTNSADLIIIARNLTGDLNSYGHGYLIGEDLFTVAGRASYVLNQLTGETFAVVHPTLTVAESAAFKQQWVQYITDLNVKKKK